MKGRHLVEAEQSCVTGQFPLIPSPENQTRESSQSSCVLSPVVDSFVLGASPQPQW